MTPQVLFIGIGTMGRAMVRNLVEKGNLDQPVIIFNRTPSRASALAESLPPGSVEVVDAPDALPAAVDRADVIFSIVANDSAVEELFELILSPANGVGSLEGKTFVECSTVAPDTADRTGERVRGAGGTYLASPVFGAPAVAEAGKLIFVPAGPAEAIEVLRPLVEDVMGRDSMIAFPDAAPGTSLKLKLIGNSCILNMVAQLSESLTLAEQSGVGPEPFGQFVDMLFGGVYSAYLGRMTSGTYWKAEKPLFSAAGGIKDITHAINLGASVGVELKNAETAREYLERATEHSSGDKEDIAGMYGATREAAGLPFENDA